MNRLVARWIQRNFSNAMLVLVFGCLFVYPIVRLLLLPWFPSLGPAGMQGVHPPASGGVPMDAIANTVRLAFASTLVAVPSASALPGFWSAGNGGVAVC